MDNLKSFIEFLNENELNEDTVDGYKYHFTFEDKDYTIVQGKKNKTIFGIKNDKGGWKVMTKGHLFDPKEHGHSDDPNEFFQFIQKGIKYFNVRNPIELDDVKESEWAKFFDFEIKKRPGRINKTYVVLKMHCGKAAAKWLAKH